MQALNNLAIVYATFEQAGQNMEVDVSEGDLLFADVRTPIDKLSEAQQHLEHMHGEQKSSLESLDTAFTEHDNCLDLQPEGIDVGGRPPVQPVESMEVEGPWRWGQKLVSSRMWTANWVRSEAG